MKQPPRSPHLKVETLELRDLPSMTSPTGALVLSPMPGGWSQWSNDGSTVFATAAGQGLNGTTAIVSSGGSRTAGLAWETQTEPGDTAVSAQVDLTSLVPTFVFTNGSNLNSTTPTYLAAVVTRGATVSVIQVVDGVSTTLATVSSPSTAYFSGNWINLSLIPNGTSVAVQVIRQDTGQYLNTQGTWQSTSTSAIVVNTTLSENSGFAGVGRMAEYAGAVDLDNFTITPSPPTTISTSPVIDQTFDTTASGAMPGGWQNWSNNSVGSVGASPKLSLSPPNSIALSGTSNTSVRAWSDAALPSAVSAAAAVELNSLIPAQLIVDGTNMGSATPTYDAVAVSRGVQASLVQVVNGVTRTLASISSPSSSYMSNQWVKVQLTAQGTELLASVYRTDEDQWLTSSGTWSSTPTDAFDVENAADLSAGYAGVGRVASYAGTVYVDNFTAGAIGSVGPAVTVTSSAGSGSVSGPITFQATANGKVRQLVFILNGQVVSTSTSSSASWTLNTSALANGTYNLIVLAGGLDGTVGEGVYSLTVANSPPPPPSTGSTPIAINGDPIAAGSYSPVPSSDTLFGPNGPSYLDVDQGEDGDCWLIASLAEVAEKAPQDIKNMFTYDGTTVVNGDTVGVYTVRFYNSKGVAKYVTIDTELPDGGGLYDHPINGVLWVALAEKAYAVANGLGYVATSEPGSNSYDALNSAYPAWALQAITDASASSITINPAQAASAWTAGNFVILSTISPASSEIVGDHDYAVVGYNASTGLFELLNPWGGSTTSDLCPQDTQVYGLFSANASFILANFSTQSTATAAALPNSLPGSPSPTNPQSHQETPPQSTPAIYSIQSQVLAAVSKLAQSHHHDAASDDEFGISSSSGVFVG